LSPVFWALFPIITFLVIFFVGPFIWTFFLSFQVKSALVPSGTAFGLAHYAKLLTDVFYLRVLLQTVLLGLAVTLFTVLLGYPCAYFLTRMQPKYRGLYLSLVLMPLIVSIIIRSYGWMILVGRTGFLNSILMGANLIEEPLKLIYNWAGVIIGLTHALLPYMILSINSVLEGIDPNLENSARVLGASPWQAFSRVTLPLSLEGVGTGSIIVLMLAISSFVTIILLGNVSTLTLPYLIYQQVQVAFNREFASAMGTLVLIVSLLLLYAQTRIFTVRGRAD
jgi:putative spermidine/putrescine transport system permease protein